MESRIDDIIESNNKKMRYYRKRIRLTNIALFGLRLLPGYTWVLAIISVTPFSIFTHPDVKKPLAIWMYFFLYEGIVLLALLLLYFKNDKIATPLIFSIYTINTFIVANILPTGNLMFDCFYIGIRILVIMLLGMVALAILLLWWLDKHPYLPPGTINENKFSDN